MAIRYNNLDASLKAIIPNTADVLDRVPYRVPPHAQNFLTMPSDLIADDYLTIGADVYQCKVLDQDSGETGSLANVNTPSLLTASGAMTWEVGELLLLDTEIVKIEVVVSTTAAVVHRARCGTTKAAHTTASIYQTTTPTTTQIPFGTAATLTPAVMIPSLVAEINNAILGGSRATKKASTIFDPYVATSAAPATDAERAGKVVAIANTAVTGMLVRSAIPENSVLATTENLNAAGNVWHGGATLLGGAVAAQKQTFAAKRVPTAAEVTTGTMMFYVPFTPARYTVEVVITATGINKLWVGAVNFDAAGFLIVDNTGATDFAATDTVYVTAAE